MLSLSSSWGAIARADRRWHTFDFPTADDVCRQFVLPGDANVLGAIGGALEPLTKPWNWQKVGSMTPEESAEYFTALIQAYDLSECGGETPTPYWDDANGGDADDELPPDEQPWYGQFVDPEGFVATLENWVIAGFIAYSGNLGGALAFLTLAPRFRLAWKTGDIGGIIRVIIDGADAGTVDTYSASPGVLEKDFVGDPEEETHSILMYLESFHA